MTNELAEMKLKSQEATRAYREALIAYREALSLERDAILKEIDFIEKIDGLLTTSENERYDALLDRHTTIFCELEDLYY